MKKPEMPTFTFGFDLDGVLQNRNLLTSRIAQKLFGIYIDPNYLARNFITRGADDLLANSTPIEVINNKHKLLVVRQYDAVQNHIDASGLLNQAPPVEGAREGLARIRAVCAEQGLRLATPCITSRGPKSTSLGQKWVRTVEEFSEVDLISQRVARRSKAQEAARLDAHVFADDSANSLRGMGEAGIKAFLLNYGYNQDDPVEEGVTRVDGWAELAPAVCHIIHEKAPELHANFGST